MDDKGIPFSLKFEIDVIVSDENARELKRNKTMDYWQYKNANIDKLKDGFDYKTIDFDHRPNCMRY